AHLFVALYHCVHRPRHSFPTRRSSDLNFMIAAAGGIMLKLCHLYHLCECLMGSRGRCGVSCGLGLVWSSSLFSWRRFYPSPSPTGSPPATGKRKKYGRSRACLRLLLAWWPAVPLIRTASSSGARNRKGLPRRFPRPATACT